MHSYLDFTVEGLREQILHLSKMGTQVTQQQLNMHLFKGELKLYANKQMQKQEDHNCFNTNPSSKDPAVDWIQYHYDWNKILLIW